MNEKSQKTRTLDVIAAVEKGGKREVVVAGEVAEIHFPDGATLSLLASKLFVQMLEISGSRVCEPVEHKANLQELNWSHKDGKFIERAIRELQKTIVELTVSTNRGRIQKSGPILTDVVREIDTPSGEITWEFSKTFRAVVRNSTHWAAISARAIMLMEGKYSPWLYQLAALHAGRNQISTVWSLAELREQLGASAPSFGRWIHFRDRVLLPAVAEVNHLTGVLIEWEPVKKGRQVVAVRLSCWRKDDVEKHKAMKEHARPRVGRKARREKTVELISEERAEIKEAVCKEFGNTKKGAA